MLCDKPSKSQLLFYTSNATCFKKDLRVGDVLSVAQFGRMTVACFLATRRKKVCYPEVLFVQERKSGGLPKYSERGWWRSVKATKQLVGAKRFHRSKGRFTFHFFFFFARLTVLVLYSRPREAVLRGAAHLRGVQRFRRTPEPAGLAELEEEAARLHYW